MPNYDNRNIFLNGIRHDILKTFQYKYRHMTPLVVYYTSISRCPHARTYLCIYTRTFYMFLHVLFHVIIHLIPSMRILVNFQVLPRIHCAVCLVYTSMNNKLCFRQWCHRCHPTKASIDTCEVLNFWLTDPCNVTII